MLHRAWERTAQGGGVAVVEVGRRCARIDYVECELFDVAYFRRAVRAMALMLASHATRQVKVVDELTGVGAASLTATW